MKRLWRRMYRQMVIRGEAPVVELQADAHGRFRPVVVMTRRTFGRLQASIR